jgi:hypothetical protein
MDTHSCIKLPSNSARYFVVSEEEDALLAMEIHELFGWEIPKLKKIESDDGIKND